MPVTSSVIKEVMASGKIRNTDFFELSESSINIDWVVPIRSPHPENTKPIAAIVTGSHADHFMIPTLKSWPIPSKTSEILMMEKVGDEALYLFDSTHNPSGAMSRRRFCDMKPGRNMTLPSAVITAERRSCLPTAG